MEPACVRRGARGFIAAGVLLALNPRDAHAQSSQAEIVSEVPSGHSLEVATVATEGTPRQLLLRCDYASPCRSALVTGSYEAVFSTRSGAQLARSAFTLTPSGGTLRALPDSRGGSFALAMAGVVIGSTGGILLAILGLLSAGGSDPYSHLGEKAVLFGAGVVLTPVGAVLGLVGGIRYAVTRPTLTFVPGFDGRSASLGLRLTAF